MEEKRNIFSRFFRFIKNKFNKNEIKQIPEKTTPDETKKNKEKDNSFRDNIKIKEENTEILDLLKKYENNEIDLHSLSYEEIFSLNELYQKQISKLEQELNDKNIEIDLLRN